MPGNATPRLLRSAVGIRVRAHRRARGWDQQTLADRAEVAVSQISRLETGHTAGSVNTILRISWALGLKPAELLPDLTELKIAFGQS